MNAKIFTLGVLMLISSSLFGQLAIDAGNDTIVCVGLWGVDTTEIGGKPTALGGTEPYTYSWETNFTIGSNTFGASYFLDDSTKANPKIVNYSPTALKFILTVSDNNGAVLRDTVNVRFSNFVYTEVYFDRTINQGDTVTLRHNIGGGIKPLSFTWSPNYNISDTTTSNPRAWPEIDTDYTVFATDSAGCVSERDFFRIDVTTAGIIENKEADFKSVVFPNPLDVSSTIYLMDCHYSDAEIKVINTQGQLILSDKMDSDSYQIGDKINTAGIYIYLILRKDEILSAGRLVKK